MAMIEAHNTILPAKWMLDEVFIQLLFFLKYVHDNSKLQD